MSEFEKSVHGFVASICKRLGTEAVAVAPSDDNRATVVVCENGNVYRVTMAIAFEQIAEDVEPEVEG